MAWQKGISGNPAGRPPNGQTFMGALRRELARVDRRDRTGYERIAAAVVARAIRGDLEAARWIADRVDGRVAQTVDVATSHQVTVVPWLPAVVGALPSGEGDQEGDQEGDDQGG
jgi:Family of unknown function (DUF5681)